MNEAVFLASLERFLLIYLRLAMPENKIVTIPLNCNTSLNKNGMYTVLTNNETAANLWFLNSTCLYNTAVSTPREYPMKHDPIKQILKFTKQYNMSFEPMS